MATITTIAGSDLITDSRTNINDNFANLNTDKIETSVLDTDTTLAANSDSKVATQKAVKAYVDAGGNVNASTTNKGIVEEATQAEVDAGTATGGTGARLYVNPSTTFTKFVTTEAFASAAAPTSFTDLDLSSIVGSVQRTVMLKVTCNTGGGTYYSFKRKGVTGTMPIISSGGGVSWCILTTSGDIGFVMVTTDTSGVVQWATNSGSTTVVNVEAYW